MINYDGRMVPARKKPFSILSLNRSQLVKGLQFGVAAIVGVVIAVNIGGSYYLPSALQFAIMVLVAPIAPLFIFRPRLAMWMLLIFGNFLFFINRFMPNLPMGMGLEALYVVAALGTIIKASIEKKWPKANIPKLIVFALILYSIYYAFQIFNPNSPGPLNMFYGFRWWLLPVLVPWLASVWLNTGRDLRRFFIIWLLMTAISALYACWQQGIPGSSYRFTEGELGWLADNPTHDIWGTIRIFSTLGSADAMGMYMVAGFIVALAMLTSGFLPMWAKLSMIALIPLFMTVMLWTMTRSAYAALPLGLLIITFVTRNRLLVTFTSIMAVVYIILSITGAGRGNVYIARFFTTTETSNDESYQVRQEIQNRVIGKVFDSPIGYGPATTGHDGAKTLAASGGDQADAELAGTATDNYYMRIGLEAGWLGTLFFIILAVCTVVSSLMCYYKARSRSAQYMIVSIVAVLAAMLLGSWANNYFQYPPLTQFFFISLGLLGPLRDIKEEDLIPAKKPRSFYQ